MSSDDAGDDSGFDKEAEREKLREKYEQDQRDRENTRRMSELLLQGATMTGKHCGECGDPIFRYDGQEFCPTCQQEVEGGAAEAADDGTDDGADAERDAAPTEADATGDTGTDATAAENRAGERPTPGATADRTVDSADEAAESADEAATADDEPRVEIEGVRVADRHADRSNLRRPPSEQGSDRRDQTARGRRDSPRPEGSGRRGGGHARHRAGDAYDRNAPGRGDDARERDRAVSASGRAHGAGDLDPAREALVRTLTDLARRAEETDDAGHARELLAAAREAAEALAALDRANH